MLNVAEAAEMINVKTGTLYNWVWQRKIPYVKTGRMVKFDIKDLDKWIEKNKVSLENFIH